MNINMKKVVLIWIAICFLVPSNIKIAGATVLDFFVYSVVGLSFFSWLSCRSRLRLSSKVEQSLVFFLLVVIISYFYNGFSPFDEQKAFVASLGLSPDFLFARLTIYGLLTVLMLMGGYHVVASAITRREDCESVVRVILASGTLNAIITIVYWAVTTGFTFDRYNFIPPIEGSQGIHLNYMALVCLIAIAYALSGEISKLNKIYLYLVIALTGFSMLTVMVRQGWMMFLLSIAIYFLLYMIKQPSRKNKRRIYSLALLFLVGISVLIIKNQALLLDLFTDVFSITGTDSDQGSWLMRFALVQQGINVFSANPFWGVGFGHYPAYSTVPIYITGVETFVTSPHNGVVTILAETGIAGFICLVTLSYFLVRENYSVYKLCSDKTLIPIVSVVFSLLFIAVTSQLISNSIILPLPTERSMTQSSFIFWILFGLVAGINKMSKAEKLIHHLNPKAVNNI